MKTQMKTITKIAILSLILAACESNYTPKPYGNIRIDLPEKTYKVYNADCPYTFEYIDFAELEKKKNCWLNIAYKGYSGKIHLTYKSVEDNLEQLLRGSEELTFVHTVKADGIDSKVYTRPEDKVYGVFYNIEGNAATSTQFFVTDSTQHFLRGVVYFNSAPNADSLAPVTNYIQEDVQHLMETLKWVN